MFKQLVTVRQQKFVAVFVHQLRRLEFASAGPVNCGILKSVALRAKSGASSQVSFDPPLSRVPMRELALRLRVRPVMKTPVAGEAARALMRPVRVILPVLLGFAISSGASAQSFERLFRDTGHLVQPRRAAIRVEWEKLSPREILCVDSRLRRARRSVNTLIDRGISPTDNRVTSIVSDCRSGGDSDSSNVVATPSFNCLIAVQPDELAICATPELARLDRAVVEGYERMLRTDGSRAAKSVAEPLLGRRHACGADIDCIKRVQLTAIAAFQARGAPAQVPAPAQVTGREKATYSVAGLQLGNNVGVGSADYRDYTCVPTTQYPGLTGCQRQLAERSRRRRIFEFTSFFHAPDGSAVYINQNLEPVAMDENDAHDEINRLSETLGKATLLSMPPTRGVLSGLIASWGAVSLQPLDPAHAAELAAGKGNKLGVLVDTLGNPQRSAQLGLPIYRLGGGAGYVWSASWNGRGRGTLRMLAIDASRLPDEVIQANPSADPPASVSAPTAPTGVTAAPDSSPPDGAKAAVATQPAPSVAAQSAQKSVDQVASEAKTPAAAASPPANVRVVGPPIALQPTASAEMPTPSSSDSAIGRGLMIFSIALIAALIGALGYFLKKPRNAMLAAAATPASATPHELAVPQKMDLTALVPAESPASIAGLMEAPKTDKAMAASEMGKRTGSGPSSAH
ncbi:hypothetical protein ACO2JO_04140 [Leptospira interrogans]